MPRFTRRARTLIVVVASAVGLLLVFGFDWPEVLHPRMPREVLGRTPEEWRDLLHELLNLVGIAVVAWGWIGGELLLRLAQRRSLGPPQCAACGYPVGGLGAGAPCPECGGTERSRRRRADPGTRDVMLTVIAALGFGSLLTSLCLVGGASYALFLVHSALALPVMLFARRPWLTLGATAVLAAVPFAAIAAGTWQAVWESKHSHDAFAFIGTLGAPFLGWIYGAGGYLLAGLIVWWIAGRQVR